jgi:hypothetical protein
LTAQWKFRIYLTLSLLLLGAFLYGVLWIIAASDLEFAVCNGHYDLLDSRPQCRGPGMASMFTALSLAASAVAIWGAFRQRRRLNK